MQEAYNFYKKNGNNTIIIARFVPVLRTFAPIVAGIIQMDFKKFAFYNIIACFFWAISMLSAGYFLEAWFYQAFHVSLKKHLDFIIMGLIFLTSLPLIWSLFFKKKKA